MLGIGDEGWGLSPRPLLGEGALNPLKTNREDLIAEKLDLILMYAIGQPQARQKTEAAGKIAIGIKEDLVKDEQMAAYKSLKYLCFITGAIPRLID